MLFQKIKLHNSSCKNNMKTPLLIVVCLLLVSCGSAPTKKTVTQTTPSWYLNPPSDTSSVLYAVGSGETQEQAVKDALVYLAAKLSVSVSSSTTINKTLHEGTYSFSETELSKQTSTKIKQVEINQFMQLKMQQIGYEQFVTLIKSNKSELALDYQSQLKLQMKKFQQDTEINSKNHGYTTYKKALQYYNKLPRFTDKLAILKGLSPSKNITIYQTHIKDVTSLVKYLKSKTIFKVTANKIKSFPNYKKTLHTDLIKRGFTLSQSKSTNHIKLTIHEKTTKAEGFNIIRSRINIILYERGKIVFNENLQIKGQGITAFQSNNEIQRKLSIKLNDIFDRKISS